MPDGFSSRKRFDRLFFTVLAVPLDFATVVAAGLVAWSLRFSETILQLRPVLFTISFAEYFTLVLAFAALTVVTLAVAGVYRFPNADIGPLGLVLRILLATSATLAAIALVVFFRQELFGSRFLVLVGWVFAVAFLLLERSVFGILKRLLARRYGFGMRRAVLIGADQVTDRFAAYAQQDSAVGFRIVKRLLEPDLSQVEALAASSGVDTVILADPNFPRERVVPLIEFANERHIGLFFVPNLFQALTANASVGLVGDIPLVELRRTALEGWGRVLKRGMDILGAGIGILVFAIPMAFIAFAITVDDSAGPIFYRNRRAGQYGKPFSTLKFRSMGWKYATGPGAPNPEWALAFERELAAKQSVRPGPVWKILNDPRRTRVGRFLERNSLDELPQFLNVLKGDMSLVGPRPHMLEQVEQYEKRHKRVLTIRPGITGLAQISGRSDLDFNDEVRLDTYYIENWSPWLDLKIMLKTPLVVLFRKHRS